MTRAAFTGLAMLGLLFASAATAAADPTVSASGLVTNEQAQPWTQGMRLSDLTSAAGVDPQAWYLGSQLYRESAKPAQLKLKAGLLFDLQTALARTAMLSKDNATSLLQRLQAQVESYAVTGRVPAAMNPLKQRLADENLLLEAGDHVLYVARSEQVRVTGAVVNDCTLPFSTGGVPITYVTQCPRHAAADVDYVYLIQPDGHIERLGAASWNEERAWVANGAIIYVPLRGASSSAVVAEFNQDMAAFLATQPPYVEPTNE